MYGSWEGSIITVTEFSSFSVYGKTELIRGSAQALFVALRERKNKKEKRYAATPFPPQKHPRIDDEIETEREGNNLRNGPRTRTRHHFTSRLPVTPLRPRRRGWWSSSFLCWGLDLAIADLVDEGPAELDVAECGDGVGVCVGVGVGVVGADDGGGEEGGGEEEKEREGGVEEGGWVMHRRWVFGVVYLLFFQCNEGLSFLLLISERQSIRLWSLVRPALLDC